MEEQLPDEARKELAYLKEYIIKKYRDRRWSYIEIFNDVNNPNFKKWQRSTVDCIKRNIW
jgi:predicted nucleic acid-binding OB-fold protein